MIDAFKDYLRTRTGLTDAEVEHIAALGEPRQLKRNGHILEIGGICRHKTFIVSGLLYTYGVADDGSESILQFSPEYTWTLDAESYDRAAPSRVAIAAVEPASLLLFRKQEFHQLTADIPALAAFSSGLISQNIHNSRQRLLTMLSANPEQQYLDFVNRHPELLQRLPLRMIASYLGISLKTLTRIRHNQWAR